eukprot:s428_g5.t1
MLSAALVAGCCELSRKHTRSPELFHELVLANGKMPTWQPRSGKVTGLWFNLIQDVKNASAKTLVLKSEDFTDHVSATLEKMASFLAVSASGFALDVALGRTNSQASAELRGVDTVQRDPVKIGVYEISGNRPMLCATRSLIYSKTQDVCQVLSSSFGVRYDACLGGGTGECTDTAAHSIFAISLGRAVTTMALPVTRFLRNVRLASVAECKEVQRLRGLEGVALEAPVLLEKQRDWYARFWNLEFFKRDCGHDYWPLSWQGAIDQMTLHTNIADFVEFTRTVQRMDRKCDQDKSIAFPRLILDGYAPFFGVLRKFFDECWTKLGPDGLSDLTPRLAHAFAHAFDLQDPPARKGDPNDPMETLSRFYKVTLAATGSITRLHVENAGAHLWFNQIEGRRVFFLFPPSESRKLYEETGGPMQETSGFATRISGVDLFAPSAKRHPLFAEASCQVAVLYLGQTLVIPSGWWWYSVTLDPSVTLWHQFWTDENKSQFPEIAWEYFNYQKMTPEFWAALPRKIERLREKLAEEE